MPSHKHGGLPSAPLLWLQVDSYAEGDAESLRGTVRDLLAKLQEAERQHQSDRVAFEVSREMWGGRARAWGCWLRGPATFPAWTSRLSGCAPSRHRLERLGLGAWGTSCLLSLSWVSVRGQPWFGARLCRRAAAVPVWQSMSRKRHFAEHQDEELRAPGSVWSGTVLSGCLARYPSCGPDARMELRSWKEPCPWGRDRRSSFGFAMLSFPILNKCLDYC